MNKRKLYRNIVILAMVLAFILILTLIIQFCNLAVQNTRNKELKAQIDSINTDIANINEEIEYKESLMYIEKYAREELDLYGEGDIVFVPEN